MGFNTHVRYSVACDIRIDKNGVPFRPTTGAWAALSAFLGGPDHERDAPGRERVYAAVGRNCPEEVRDIWATSPAAARRSLEKLGWTFASLGKFGGVHSGWRAACPNHKGCLNLPEVDDSAVRATMARQLDQYAPTGETDDA
jgi:hypothetical protein